MSSERILIELNDLPKYSKWIHRILGLEPFEPKVKNEKELEREYENEKWGPLLNLLKDNNQLDLEKIDAIYYPENNKICVWCDGNLQLMSSFEAYQKYLDLVSKTLIPFLSETSSIVELGSGYGNVSLNIAKKLNLDKKFFLGEFAKSGVEASKLLANREKIDIQAFQCNFFDLNLSSVSIPENSLFFTSFALISIPKMPDDFLEKILVKKPKYIILFEPCRELYDTETLYGLLKEKYILLNDYNRNIYSYFTNFPELNLNKVEKNIIGLNPLLPVSILIFERK